jgi:hypothetical protein
MALIIPPKLVSGFGKLFVPEAAVLKLYGPLSLG